MATEATFDNQLQALATATANFANGKDTQIKNTIITALGGSTQATPAPAGKTEGVITIEGWDVYPPCTATITANSGEDIYWSCFYSSEIDNTSATAETAGKIQSGSTFTADREFCMYCFFCPGNQNYTAAYNSASTED